MTHLTLADCRSIQRLSSANGKIDFPRIKSGITGDDAVSIICATFSALSPSLSLLQIRSGFPRLLAASMDRNIPYKHALRLASKRYSYHFSDWLSRHYFGFVILLEEHDFFAGVSVEKARRTTFSQWKSGQKLHSEIGFPSSYLSSITRAPSRADSELVVLD